MPFIPGIELSRRFYREDVRPILEAYYPGLQYAAALIGPGSDVLGFDTAMSADHDWGPRGQVFLPDADAGLAGPIHELLCHELPHLFAGYPVGTMGSADEAGVRRMHPPSEGPVDHLLYVGTLRAFVRAHLAYELGQPLDAVDWLTFSSQTLRELTAGAVHHDEVGELSALRQELAYYPHDVWLYLLASSWTRIGQEEHLMPRAGHVGDELGSALIGSRLARDCMNLGFLMERQYAPYPKWFGTAFKQLACARDLYPILWRTQVAPTWQEREDALAEGYLYLARMHNALSITETVAEQITGFHERPFKVINGGLFADALCATIEDPSVRQIASRRLIGSIDQISDNTDLHDVEWRGILRGLYVDGQP